MCSGKWFVNSGGRHIYAYKPSDGKTPSGGLTVGGAISQADASISVAWCAAQMKDTAECSQEFIGVAHNNGHCWCAKKGGNCEIGDIANYLIAGGHFFQFTSSGQASLISQSIRQLFFHDARLVAD